MRLSKADLIAVERELCRRSLAAFAKRAWHVLEPATELKWGWALDAVCEHLEAATHGEVTRLVMNVPPGCMKSLLTGVIWPAWEWGARDMQTLRYVGTSHNQDLAIRDSTKCRRLIQSEWYQELWPVRLTSDQNAKTKFDNDKAGFRQASSFSGITGHRGDRVILDDPHSVDDANSAAKLDADVRLFREALPTRVNNEQSVIVCIMQRLAVGDISDVAIELGYQHLCLPMEYEQGRSKWFIGLGDPRKEDGELLFPDRFSSEKVAELKSALGTYATAGQLQQRPSPRGGGMFKESWFGYWKHLPKIEARFITVDTAQKTGKENDYSVLQCWGRSTTGQAVMIDQVRGKWEAPDLLVQARSFWIKQQNEQRPTAVGSALRAMYVEDKVSGTGLVQTLRREGIPVLPVQRNRDKISRGSDAAPFVESGNVLLPQDAPWLSDFLAEAATFPAGAHDDQLDPFFDAVSIVQRIPVVNAASTVALIPSVRKW